MLVAVPEFGLDVMIDHLGDFEQGSKAAVVEVGVPAQAVACKTLFLHL
jgi:hypothetical protein